MSEPVQFAYAVTPSPGMGEARFEKALVKEVFPKIQILRRDVSDIRHDLVKLPAANGHAAPYLWLVGLDVFSLEPSGPELAELNENLGSLGTAKPWSGPFAFIHVDLARSRAVIKPNSVEVFRNERMIWSFHGVEPGHQPLIDFFSFQEKGDAKPTKSFGPPFQELHLTSTLITSGGASGPEGRYWYEVSLVPGRRAQKEKVVRLECDPWPADQPGKGRHAAVIEISDPPPRKP